MPLMPLPPDSIDTFADRPHWTVSNGHATFAPVPGGWRAVVRRLPRPSGPSRFHVAVLDRAGVTRFAMEAGTVDDAIRSAERGVLARNALRLVPRL
jgi:hypothetical protein